MSTDDTNSRLHVFNPRRHLDYVTFPRWPEDGCDWIHPDDTETARRLLPGRRVFVHQPTETEFQVYEYGDDSFRALPRMQQRVAGDGLLIGDRVEVRSRLGRRRAVIAIICDMSWDDYHRRIDYRIRYRQMSSQLLYGSEDFVRLVPSDLPEVEIEINVMPPSESDPDRDGYRVTRLENLL